MQLEIKKVLYQDEKICQISTIKFDTLHKINIENQTISYVCSANNLDVTITNNLSWNDHVNSVSKNISRLFSFYKTLSLEVKILQELFTILCDTERSQTL